MLFINFFLYSMRTGDDETMDVQSYCGLDGAGDVVPTYPTLLLGVLRPKWQDRIDPVHVGIG